MASPWILGDKVRHHEFQLVCLPHAGGSASSYRTWLASLAADMDVLPVQLPGRESRFRTPFVTDLSELVGQLRDELIRLELPGIVLFGHSMGAVVATKLGAALEQAGTPVRHLVVSGHPGHYPRPDDPRLSVGLDSSDEAVLDSLVALDPAGAQRFTHPEFRQIFLPALRADMTMLSGAVLDDKVDAPITAVAGTRDPLLPQRDMTRWGSITRADCETYWLPGGHFYLSDPQQSARLAGLVRTRLGLGSGDLPAAPG